MEVATTALLSSVAAALLLPPELACARLAREPADAFCFFLEEASPVTSVLASAPLLIAM